MRNSSIELLYLYNTRLLRSVYKQPLALHLLELLLARLARTSTKDQLAPELPSKRDVPLLCGLLVDDGVVVLELPKERTGAWRWCVQTSHRSGGRKELR